MNPRPAPTPAQLGTLASTAVAMLRAIEQHGYPLNKNEQRALARCLDWRSTAQHVPGVMSNRDAQPVVLADIEAALDAAHAAALQMLEDVSPAAPVVPLEIAR